MKDKLHTETIVRQFATHNTLQVADIYALYQRQEPSIPLSTVRWRIHSLLQKGLIHRVGNGKYGLGEANIFTLEPSKKMKDISTIIQNNFPYIKFCTWELSSINNFSQHLINYNITFADVDKDAVEAVYLSLKENTSNVMLAHNLYGEISDFSNAIIVRPLITDAPLITTHKTPVDTLEKFLVDIAVDKEFIAFQGYEILHIYRTAFKQYTINENTMLRYAGRKGKREEIAALIKSIKRQ